jgi:hypothetical protein
VNKQYIISGIRVLYAYITPCFAVFAVTVHSAQSLSHSVTQALIIHSHSSLVAHHSITHHSPLTTDFFSISYQHTQHNAAQQLSKRRRENAEDGSQKYCCHSLIHSLTHSHHTPYFSLLYPTIPRHSPRTLYDESINSTLK